MRSQLKQACLVGLALIEIPQVNGQPTKGPIVKGWSYPRSASNMHGYSSSENDFILMPEVYHKASKTLALDIDDFEITQKLILDTTGIDISDWLNDSSNVQIKSPKFNRAKLLFRVPEDMRDTGLKQFKHNSEMIFELRCGNCQDVLLGIHPEGNDYQYMAHSDSECYTYSYL